GRDNRAPAGAMAVDHGAQQRARLLVKRCGRLIEQPERTRRNEKARQGKAALLALAQDTRRQVPGAREPKPRQHFLIRQAAEQSRPIAQMRSSACVQLEGVLVADEVQPKRRLGRTWKLN